MHTLSLNTETMLQGIVYKKSLGTYFVNVNGQPVVCSISSKLRKVLLLPRRDPKSLPYYKVYEVAEIRAVDPVVRIRAS